MTTIISGTNRKDSKTLKVATFYRDQLSIKGEQATLLSLFDLPEGVLSHNYGQSNAAFAPFQELVHQTEKFIFIIPEYNGSFPGILKVFIDHCKFPESFVGKKAALVGIASGRQGNVRGIDHFTGICHYLRLNILPNTITIPRIAEELSLDGQLVKADTLKFVQEQIDQFIRF